MYMVLQKVIEKSTILNQKNNSAGLKSSDRRYN